METFVPIIGHEALGRHAHLKRAFQSVVEELGHKPRFVDAGTIVDFRKLAATQVLVPFIFVLDGATDLFIEENWLATIRKTFPSAPCIKAQAELALALVDARAEEFSLGNSYGAPEEIRQTAAYVYQNLAYNTIKRLDLTTITRALGVSRSKLERIFHQWGHPGAEHFVKRIQMTEARRLTVETIRPLNEIGLAVGYAEQCAFSREFRHFWNISARELRRNAKSLGQNAKSVGLNGNSLPQIGK